MSLPVLVVGGGLAERTLGGFVRRRRRTSEIARWVDGGNQGATAPVEVETGRETPPDFPRRWSIWGNFS